MVADCNGLGKVVDLNSCGGRAIQHPLPESIATGRALRVAQPGRWWPVGSRRSFIFFSLALAVVLGGTALALALTTRHLEHPGWNAVLRPYLIVAPILIGLAWKLRRPESRFGPLLIGFGIASWPLSWQAANAPLVYSLGVIVGDIGVVVAAFYVALAFPVGRIAVGASRIVMALIGLAAAAHLVWTLQDSTLVGGGTLSRCGDACPSNPLYLGGPAWGGDLAYAVETFALLIATSVAIVIFARRLSTAPRPRRRAMLGVAVTSLVFFPVFLAYQAARRLLDLDAATLDLLAWSQTIMRMLFPLGFLVALVQADLFAARALERLLDRLTHRPSPRQWQDTVGLVLDDPTLRIGYWDPDRSRYRLAEGDVLEPSDDPDHTVVTIDHHGVPVAAMQVDAILRTDPELLQAAANATLLALERGTLEGELRASQLAALEASDQARRRIAQDLHDSAQQRLVALRMHLDMARRRLAQPEGREMLERFSVNVEDALGDIRAVARGTHVEQLHREGLESALRAAVGDATMDVRFEIDEVPRVPPNVEDAVYFVILEALQNVAKHAGPGATADVRVRRTGDEVEFVVADDGRGYDVGAMGGLGIENMTDRVRAAGGTLDIRATPGAGTTVTGRIPLARDQDSTASR
jgi:signal transduction histidine kinase